MESDRDSESLSALKKDPFLNSHYDLQAILGAGCFGKIIKAINRRTGQLIALKIERFKKSKLKMVLKNQIDLLKKLQGKPGVTPIYGSGDWENGTYLEMDLLGHDLNRGHQYSSTEIIDLTREALKVLEGIHSCNVVHQDLKPHNLMRDKNGALFIIDFGLSRQLPLRTKSRPAMRGFIGTPRYASIRAHNLLEQGKKDDLESLFYNLAYLYYRRLPWSKLTVPNDQRLQKIKLLKVKHGSSLFSEMPPQFQRAFDYVVSLQPSQEPDYHHLKSYFRRNKTIIMQPNSILSAQRSNVKRVSLNVTNFLQVPDPNFMKERKKKEKSDGDCQIRRTPSSTSISVFSDAIQTHLMDFIEDDEENFKEDENIEPELPPSFKMNSIVFKNPFS